MPDRARASIRTWVSPLVAAILACAATAEDLTRSSPKTPAEELATFVLADPELRIECVVSEPQVTSPVSVAWDASGRWYVAEMNDYPTAPTGGRIRILWDEDRDGRPERSEIFAGDLHFPSGVLPWRQGVLVSAAPDILYLRDLNGDGRADERRVLVSGFGEGNQQLRVNGLTWQPDGWVYGANGRSDGDIRSASGGPVHSLRRHDFRFHPDTGHIEMLAGPSQFGIAFDAMGNRFLSWNTIPIRHEVIPERYLVGPVNAEVLTSLHDCLSPSDPGHVFPASPSPQTFNRESTRHFNALAGLHIYEGRALGPNYRGSAFVGETLRNLIHRRVLEPKGSTFEARRAASESAREFLASSDSWFHPVQFATGPDGALYVCDFYRRWVEHPGFVPEQIRTKHDWREGWEHGRIWRISRKSPLRRASDMSRLSGGRLVSEFQSRSPWRRITAQRLVSESATAPPLSSIRAQLRPGRETSPEGRRLALWTLQRFSEIKSNDILAAFRDPSLSVRRSAMQIAELNPELLHTEVLEATRNLARSSEPALRLQIALSARVLPESERLETLGALVTGGLEHPWIRGPILTSSTGVELDIAQRLLATRDDPALEFLHQLGRRVGVSPDSALFRDRDPMETWIEGLPARALGTISFLSGVLEVQRAPPNGAPARLAEAVSPLREHARQVLRSRDAPVVGRVHALRMERRLATTEEASALLEWLLPIHPADLQSGAAELLLASGDASLAEQALRSAPQWSLPTRRRVLGLLAVRADTAVPLLAAIEAGTVDLRELDAGQRQTLQRHPAPEIRERAVRVFGATASPDRAQVIEAMSPLLSRVGSGEGDGRRGAAVYARHCSVCHRLGTVGVALGPDLAGIGSRPLEAILVDLLDPSRQVAPDYIAYHVELKDGEELTGLITAETPQTVTVRRAHLADTAIPRDRVKAIRSSGHSLMPDGLETAVLAEDWPDLLRFLTDPDPSLFPR